MYNLQELVEKGYVEKIETESTHIGVGYKVYVKLRNYSIGKVIIDVGIDEYLTDAITLINKMIEVDEDITKQNKRPADEVKSRRATEEDLKKIFKDADEKVDSEDHVE